MIVLHWLQIEVEQGLGEGLSEKEGRLEEAEAEEREEEEEKAER